MVVNHLVPTPEIQWPLLLTYNFWYLPHNMLYHEHELHPLWNPACSDLFLGLIQINPIFSLLQNLLSTQTTTSKLPQDSNPSENKNSLCHMMFLFEDCIAAKIPNATFLNKDLIFLWGHYIFFTPTHISPDLPLQSTLPIIFAPACTPIGECLSIHPQPSHLDIPLLGQLPLYQYQQHSLSLD